MPRIAGVVEQTSAVDAFYENVAQTVLFYTFITTILGASIAFGVVYNSMRIALSERGSRTGQPARARFRAQRSGLYPAR